MVLVFTSDTGLFPQTRDGGKIVADINGSEIWQKYGLADQAVDLLVPHIGSIKEHEFTVQYTVNPADLSRVFYPNHLGLLGAIRLIQALEPKVAVISEFGEELKTIQDSLVKTMQRTVQEMGLSTTVLPGDLQLVYDIVQAKVLCCSCRTYQEAEGYTWENASDDNPDFYYWCQNTACKDGKIADKSRKYGIAVAGRELPYFIKA